MEHATIDYLTAQLLAKSSTFAVQSSAAMTQPVYLYNSLTRQRELFTPLTDGFVGMYVCGPTVYNDVHLGNCRTFVSFDVIFRLFRYLGYKVRYVRNITDVGHLLDDGEDRMLKGARLEQLEPLEVAQKYTLGFHEMMRLFNTLPPSIEPRATGHIPEQIELIEAILANGYGYVVNGSVYFDVQKLGARYGQLSGRVVEELLAETRELKNQSDKRHPADFAIWMKADPEHILRWKSPWSVGFPGWHLECSAMSSRYLGQRFDIHGGGDDLKFPHHDNEIAQHIGSFGCTPANYWLHANMLLLNGRKMSKSDGNTISPTELFTGQSPHVSKGYTPMVVRFFMLQAHYRSTLDMTDEALQAAEKGYNRLMEANRLLDKLQPGSGTLDNVAAKLLDDALCDLCDDFNAPKALAHLFELASKIFALSNNQLPGESLSKAGLELTRNKLRGLLFDVLGLTDDKRSSHNADSLNRIMQLILEMRTEARNKKDWAQSDRIRDGLAEAGIKIKDSKDGTTWELL